MSSVANLDLMSDLRKFGATEVNACFSCGNCTATCPLADNDAAFPRRFIRLAQVGLEDELVASKELWTCYQCGLCTTKCPTEADPAEFMATARRYAIQRYDKTGLARLMYTKPWAAVVVAVIGVVLFGLFFVSLRGTQSVTELALFDFIPYPVIHTTGIVVMVVLAVFALIGAVSLARDMAKKEGVTWTSLWADKESRGRTGKALWYAVGIESIGQKRFREDCADDDPVDPLHRRRWLIHALTLWGFLGLFVATALDYGLDVVGIKPTGTLVPLYYPTRLLGTVAGLALMYGVTWFMINRYRHHGTAAKESKASDWLFLILLWLTGFTGFVIEVALYVPPAPAWGYWVFLIHVAIAMELLLFVPFTKFAHVMYRPIALFFYGLAKEKSAA